MKIWISKDKTNNDNSDLFQIHDKEPEIIKTTQGEIRFHSDGYVSNICGYYVEEVFGLVPEKGTCKLLEISDVEY